MLDSERNNHETDVNEATSHSAGTAPAPATPAVPAALFQPPQVLFQPPAPVGPPGVDRDSGERDSGGRDFAGRDADSKDSDSRPEPDAESGRAPRRSRSTRPQSGDGADDQAGADAEGGRTTSRRTRGRTRSTRVREAAPDDDLFSADSAAAVAEAGDAADIDATAAADVTGADDAEESGTGRRRRRRNTRTRGRAEAAADDDADGQGSGDDSESDDAAAEADGEGEGGASNRRRRRKRRRGVADGDVLSPDDPPDTVVHVREPHNPADDVRAIKGSTRLEAKKQRRREGRESGRRRPPVITESEFLARRESVERTMIVRQRGDRTQIAVLEDGVLVEHYVNRTTHASYVGNVYLGKVQNVLPSMEAAFVDIGKGRNAVLYAGEVNFDASGLEGQPKRIESALKPGQSVIVQVTKDPVGHKGARLTSQVSLPGRYLVYVPGASMTGISRKLPDTERTRLKQILKKVTPEHAGVIVRTAAEGAAEAELDRDITRLAAQWENLEKKAKTASAPALLYGEPDLTIRVVRDVFNEDFNRLIVCGDEGWEIIDEYVRYVAPHLADRISRWDTPENEDADEDVFAAYRIDEQLAKALERKVWLPSGGSLVIDRTEAMTVIDVNTGKFTGQGGNLEETVTRNNLEAAEEIVRQLRLRDVGGIVVIDFIDMVLESNRELVLRRLLECLARDRTKHQVAEVTSLGLVQMTRKRVGAGLLEAFSQPCECCNGRGAIITLDAPAEPAHRASAGTSHRPVPAPPAHAPGNGNGNGNARSGYANGRRNNRRDDDRNARDTYQDSAGDAAVPADFPADAPPADPPRTDAPQTDAPRTDTAASAPSHNGTGTPADGNGGRRTRRSTSAAGTAFATAVLVEDTPAVAPVVTTVPPVTEPSPSGFAPAVTGGAPAAETTPPVRRTRAGSAMARVTVVTDPEPPAAPAPAPEPAPADALTEAVPVTEAVALVTEAPIPAAEAAGEATAPPAEALAEPALEPATPSFSEPTVVAASMFDSPAPVEAPTEEPVTEPATESAVTAESATEASAASVDQETATAPQPEAADEPAAVAATPQAEPVPEPPAAAPAAAEAAPADQGNLESPEAGPEGEATAEPAADASTEGETRTWW
jgi:ribonuclease E